MDCAQNLRFWPKSFNFSNCQYLVEPPTTTHLPPSYNHTVDLWWRTLGFWNPSDFLPLCLIFLTPQPPLLSLQSLGSRVKWGSGQSMSSQWMGGAVLKRVLELCDSGLSQRSFGTRREAGWAAIPNIGRFTSFFLLNTSRKYLVYGPAL